MTINDPLFVVAYNRQAFEAWCKRKGYNPNGRGVRYVRGVEVIDRQQNIRILFVYGWQERSDARAIYNRAMLVGRRPS